MELVGMIGLALMAAFCALLLRQLRPEMGMLLVLAAGAVVLLAVVSRLTRVVAAIEGLYAKASLQPEYMRLLLRVIGIGFLAEFGAQTLTDAGQPGLAEKVSLLGRVLVLCLAAPMLTGLVEKILELAA